MMRGMVVLRDGRPMVVYAIQGTNPGPGVKAGPALYTLQDMDTRDLEFVTGPAAEDIPLLPRCVLCGPTAQPGQFGAPGWRCSPLCSAGTKARAQG